MWAIKIEDGKEQRQLFYFSEVKARDRIKELLITQINKLMLEYGENPIFLDVDLDYIPCFDLQSMLSVMIKCECGGRYTQSHKSHHLKTKQHVTYMNN